MRPIRHFAAGLSAHGAGIRFAMTHKGYLPVLFIPFIVTIVLFVAGFSTFTAHSDQVLAWLWRPEAAGSDGFFMAVLQWLYAYVFKYLLYAALMGLMYFLFMVVANIIASPLYDSVARRVRRREAERLGVALPPPAEMSLVRVVLEELKKALFVVVLPIPLFFIPVVGQACGLLLAMLLIAWDFTDFSISLDTPTFAARARFVRANPARMLGFGLPLLVPFLNLLLFPFAILGGSLLYQQAARDKA
ncbi:MAG: EI24 domain-containing protein [Desulfovibrionaceae bacterium]